MCGIAGCVTKDGSVDIHGIVLSMCEAIRHRGPDDNGSWFDYDVGLAFGHQRLSIQDLSDNGHQPMFSSTGRYIIAFNGEIYNFKVLRESLDSKFKIKWRGSSDTEVLLELFEAFGIVGALDKINGMFSIALYDRFEKDLYLIRDRFGEKPLYYGSVGNIFAFSSDLNSFKSSFSAELRVDEEALRLLLQYSNIPAPYSIYQGIYKVSPGKFIRINLNVPVSISPSNEESYWDMAAVIDRASSNIFPESDADVTEEFAMRLRNSVQERMVSDAPIGAFLSGGFDSVLVSAVMSELSSTPIRTFSIGFDDESVNEAVYAKRIAEHLGTNHSELYVSQGDLLDTVPVLTDVFSEPFADPSQIPTLLLCKMAREKVKVCLSGDGGDEVFCGYNRYMYGATNWRKFSSLPVPLRKFISGMGLAVSPALYDKLLCRVPLLKRDKRGILSNRLLGDKVHRFLEALRAKDLEEYFIRVLSKLPPETLDGLMRMSNWEKSFLLSNVPRDKDDYSTLMYLDSIFYLPDNNLVKVDRCSMAVSLEVRAPFLDHTIFDFAWSLPLRMKLRGGEGKWIVKQLTYQYVPKSLMERPKMGFGVPLARWLREELKVWAEDLLSKQALGKHSLVDFSLVNKCWSDHKSGRKNNSLFLWNLLSFQAWYYRQ